MKTTTKKKAAVKKTSKKKAAKKAVGKKVLRKVAKSASKKAVKKPAKVYDHHPDHYNTSEEYLIRPLEEDLKDAWFKIREFGESLGEQRIYASGQAIMFSRKVCYFFVRPKKAFLEVVLFLQTEGSKQYFKAIRPVSKTKYAHTFRLFHADQLEGEILEAITEAYHQTPAASAD